MRFELVDAVLERDEQRIVTVKNVTAAEEYLGDHFPGFPILPGVMMLEAMVQAARRLLEETGVEEAGTAPPSSGRWVLGEVRNVRYGNMVRPGQKLTVEVQRIKAEGGRHTFQGRGTVEGAVAVQGRFVMRNLICQ